MRIILFLAIGLVIGAASGALGIGGGVLLVPALVWLCGMEYQQAAGTTLAVLVVPVVLPAVIFYARLGKVDVEAAIWLAIAFAGGSVLGALLVSNGLLPDHLLKLVFGLMMMYIAVRFILGSDSDALSAAAGLAAVLFAWVSYLWLRALGRRHPPPPRPPSLGEQIRLLREQGHGDTDYSI
jgi:uncharacterized membrane protein YfcA